MTAPGKARMCCCDKVAMPAFYILSLSTYWTHRQPLNKKEISKAMSATLIKNARVVNEGTITENVMPFAIAALSEKVISLI